MDEITLIGALYPEPPADGEADAMRAGARGRLLAEVAAAASDPGLPATAAKRHPATVGRLRRRRAVVRRPVFVGLAAAGLAAGLLVAQVVTGRGGPLPGPAPADAATVLAHAAAAAAADPEAARSGKYRWNQELQRTLGSPEPSEPVCAETWWAEERRGSWSVITMGRCRDRAPATPPIELSRNIRTRHPLGPAGRMSAYPDPATLSSDSDTLLRQIDDWISQQNSAPVRVPVPSSSPTAGTTKTVDAGSAPGTGVTAPSLSSSGSATPGSTATVRSTGTPIAADRTRREFAALAALLRDDPGRPSRAALFRAMAKIPGISVIPGAEDAIGRHGVALGIDGGAPHEEVLLDPASYRYLGRRDTLLLDDGRAKRPVTTVTAQLRSKTFG